jgi:hypothetical protein
MTPAAAIALSRALWPLVTEAAAPDAYLTAWYADALRQAGESWFGDDRATAVAHLLAHAAYRQGRISGSAPSAGAAGPLTAISTLGMSASWASITGYGVAGVGDQILAATQPGAEYLALRARMLGSLPSFVAF